jgi:hypothetical protein
VHATGDKRWRLITGYKIPEENARKNSYSAGVFGFARAKVRRWPRRSKKVVVVR